MAFKDMFSRKTPLQLALDRGMQPDADLAHELRTLEGSPITSRADAQAVCRVLERLGSEGSNVGGESAFRAVVSLFLDIEGTECPAFAVLAERGTELLVEIVDSALQNSGWRADIDVLFALKILACYGTPEGTDSVLRAACQPLRPDSSMWGVILRAYSEGHPERERLFRELSDPLPTDFLAVSLLDIANLAQREGAVSPHPFDSAAGKEQLERWLTDGDEDHVSYAVSATAALPWISGAERDALLALAFDHPSADVQMEAAWAAATLGREAGIEWLARTCLDVNLTERAKQYLAELGRANAIPEEAKDAGFQAKSAFAHWLAHPNELGRPPDEVEIVDARELNWPPEGEPKPMWLLKYRIKDQTGLKDDDMGVGVVGNITCCLFNYKLEQRPPEDAYAIHCYWELTIRELILEIDVPEDSTEYDPMLSECKLEGLGQARIVFVAELSAELKYPLTLVALGKATRQGQPGWIVLDGPRSRWYAASEMPADALDKTVLMVHVGRVLLGFRDEPDRRQFLASAGQSRTPDQIVAAYERLLDQVHSDPSQAKALLGRQSVLGSAWPDYVSALAASRSQSQAVCIGVAYESLLAAVAHADPSLQGELLGCFSPLGKNFDSYVDALIELNRQADVPAILEKFQPHWDHNLGFGKLGGAAFRSGHDQVAEKHLVKLRQSMKDWPRSEGMDFLAEIWKRQGRVDEAHTLLIDALKGLLEQSGTATGSDRELFEEWFQDRRSTYLKLFPERAGDELRRQGISASTLDGSPQS